MNTIAVLRIAGIEIYRTWTVCTTTTSLLGYCTWFIRLYYWYCCTSDDDLDTSFRQLARQIIKCTCRVVPGKTQWQLDWCIQCSSSSMFNSHYWISLCCCFSHSCFSRFWNDISLRKSIAPEERRHFVPAVFWWRITLDIYFMVWTTRYQVHRLCCIGIFQGIWSTTYLRSWHFFSRGAWGKKKERLSKTCTGVFFTGRWKFP